MHAEMCAAYNACRKLEEMSSHQKALVMSVIFQENRLMQNALRSGSHEGIIGPPSPGLHTTWRASNSAIYIWQHEYHAMLSRDTSKQVAYLPCAECRR